MLFACLHELFAYSILLYGNTVTPQSAVDSNTIDKTFLLKLYWEHHIWNYSFGPLLLIRADNVLEKLNKCLFVSLYIY